MIYRLKIGLNEDTLEKEIKRIKVNDILIVKQGINTLKFQVVQVTTNQILTKKIENKKSDIKTVTFTINSYYDGKLYLQYSSNKGKRKVVFSDIKSIELYRNGSKIGDIDELSEETIKKQEIEKQEAREKRLLQKKQTNKETTQEFFNVLNSLELGDDLILSIGEVDEDGEIKKENITDVSLKLTNKSDKFIFDFIYNSANGIDAEKYNILKTVDNIILSKRSFRAATSGNRLILLVDIDNKKDDFQIDNIIDFKREKSVLKRPKSTKLKSIDIEAIKNNPRLRDALLKNPSLLSKLLGDRQTGVIPFELRNQGKDTGKTTKDKTSSKFKKGNVVSFSYIGDTIRGEIDLINKNSYAGRLIKDDVIRLTSDSRRENIFIHIDSFTNDDFYKCTFVVRRMKDGSPVNNEYKGMIKVDNYNF